MMLTLRRNTSESSARRRDTVQRSASDIIMSFTPASFDCTMNLN